jgi:gamma-glutamylaminecyclotransferase
VSSRVLLFVYGTLMRGEANAAFLAESRFLGPARTQPAYTLLDLGECPGMVRGGSTAVVGELYDVDVHTVAELDAFEGTPSPYQRESVRLADGQVAEAFLLAEDAAEVVPVIAGGNWRRRIDA